MNLFLSKLLKVRRLILRNMLKCIDRKNYKNKSEYWPWVRVEISNKFGRELFGISKKITTLSSISAMHITNDEFVIVGSGPSIRNVDFSALDSNRNLILLNGAISLISRFNLRPLCCVVIDSTFIENRFDVIENLPKGSRLLTTLGCLRAIHERDKKTIEKLEIFLTQNIAEPIYDIDAVVQNKAIRDGFSENIESGYVDGGTVMSVAIQFALQLSAARVFLLGFDIGNANQPRFNETQQQQLKSGLLNDYEQKILPFMMKAKDKSIEKNSIIYNCSPITILPYDIAPYFDVHELYLK